MEIISLISLLLCGFVAKIEAGLCGTSTCGESKNDACPPCSWSTEAPTMMPATCVPGPCGTSSCGESCTEACPPCVGDVSSSTEAPTMMPATCVPGAVPGLCGTFTCGESCTEACPPCIDDVSSLTEAPTQSTSSPTETLGAPTETPTTSAETGLEGFTYSPTTSPTSSPTSSPTQASTQASVSITDEDANELPNGAIAGIVVTCVVMLVCCGAAIAKRPMCAYTFSQKAIPEESGKCMFHWLDAEAIRAADDILHLPGLEECKKRGWIVDRVLDESAYTGGYADEYLGISHRWETTAQPDMKGQQLIAIKNYLHEHPRVKYVWYDYSCMWQGERTASQQDEFCRMLYNINMVYIGCSVLCIVDMSYISRFWTQFEIWLAMQKSTTSGLQPAEADECRLTIKCIHEASDEYEGNKLKDMWEAKNPQDVYETLRSPDITVTNQKDKDVQLPMILKMNGKVKDVMLAESALRDAVASRATSDKTKNASIETE